MPVPPLVWGDLCSLSFLFLQKVFCGHEHTLSNLEFAQKVEPCNNHVQAKLSWAQVHPFLAPKQGWGSSLPEVWGKSWRVRMTPLLAPAGWRPSVTYPSLPVAVRCQPSCDQGPVLFAEEGR